MRGTDEAAGSLFSYVDLEERVPARHPLRLIRRIVNDALASLDAELDVLYTDFGRPSIAPERLIRASLLQMLFSIRVTPEACLRHDAKGIHNIERLLEAAKDLPEAARSAVDMLADQLRETQEKIDDLTARIEAAQKADLLARRLAGLRPFTPRTVRRTLRRVPRTGAHSPGSVR